MPAKFLQPGSSSLNLPIKCLLLLLAHQAGPEVSGNEPATRFRMHAFSLQLVRAPVLQFIRWLRSHIHRPASYPQAPAAPRPLMPAYL